MGRILRGDIEEIEAVIEGLLDYCWIEKYCNRHTEGNPGIFLVGKALFQLRKKGSI